MLSRGRWRILLVKICVEALKFPVALQPANTIP